MEDNYLEQILQNNAGGINESENQHKEEVRPEMRMKDVEVAPYTSASQKSVKKSSFVEKIAVSLICAIVFGLVTGATFSYANNVWHKDVSVVENNNQDVIELGTASIVEAPEGEVLSTSIPTVTKEVMPSVVSITNLSVQEVNMFFYGTQKYESQSSGSGIIIGKNDTELLIVTNNHVIEGNTQLTVTFVDDSSVTAVVKGSNANIDIAVIAIKLSDITEDTLGQIKIATLGDSTDLVVGEPTIAIGNALGYGQSVTSGIVSALEREIDGFDTTLIQTDAAINPGNSGGALLNIRGEVIGINTVKVNADAVEGMGYAIPISEIKEILTDMMNKETREKVDEANRGKLGIKCVDIDEMAMLYYNMPKGTYINEVTEGSAADKAGLYRGSIITSFDGTAITSSTTLTDLLQYYEKGETVTVTVSIPKQDGTYESKDVQVTLQ